MMPPETARDDAVRATAWSRYPAAVAVLVSCTLGAILRFSCLTRKPFWFDECFSVVAARLGWGDFLHLLWWREGNMLLYYLLLRGWLHFGSTEFFIRGLSVVVAIAGIPAMYRLGRLLFDRRTAMIATILLSANAYHIRYAQEARSYSLFFLLAILSSGFLFLYLQKPSRGNFLGYVLASVAAVYAHFYALLLILTQTLALWLETRAQAPGRVLRVGALRDLRRAWLWIGLSVVPLVVFIAKTGAGPIRWIHRPTFADVLVCYERLAGNGGWPLLALYAAAGATAVFPLRRRLFAFTEESGRETRRIRFLVTWAFLPVFVTALLSFARPVFLARYFIFCLPALILLAAAGLARLQKSWQLALALAVMLLFSLKGTLAYYDHDFDLDRDGIGAASNFVLDHSQPGDAVLFHIAGTRAGYEFYKSLRGITGPEIVFPHHDDHLTYRDFTGKPAAEFVASIPQRYDRVWLVLMNNVTNKEGVSQADPTTLMLSGTLSQWFPDTQQWDFPFVEVRLYKRN